MFRFRFYAGALLITLAAVTACGTPATSGSSGGNSSGASPPGTGAASGPSSAGDSPSPIPEITSTTPAPQPKPPAPPAAVTGTVNWPDGQPARNARLDIYPLGYPFGGEIGGEVKGSADRNGHYSITGCGSDKCTALGMTFELTDSQNGGNYCYIIMRSAGNAYTVDAQAGDVIDWTMMDMPCSRDYITAGSAASTIALLKANPSITGGTWQHARQESGD